MLVRDSWDTTCFFEKAKNRINGSTLGVLQPLYKDRRVTLVHVICLNRPQNDSTEYKIANKLT